MGSEALDNTGISMSYLPLILVRACHYCLVGDNLTIDITPVHYLVVSNERVIYFLI